MIRKILLFDIDGTLVLTGGAGMRALNRAFEDTFGVLDAFSFVPMPGRTDQAIVDEALRYARVRATPEQRDTLRATYCRMLEEEITKPGPRKGILPGVVALLDAVRQREDSVPRLADRQLLGGGADQADALRTVALLPVRRIRRRCLRSQRPRPSSHRTSVRVWSAVGCVPRCRRDRRYAARCGVRTCGGGAGGRGGHRFVGCVRARGRRRGRGLCRLGRYGEGGGLPGDLSRPRSHTDATSAGRHTR